MIFFGIENIQQLFVSLQKCCVIRNKKRLCISLKPWSASRNTIRKKKEKKLSPGFHPSFVQSCGSPVDTKSGGKKAVTKFPPMVFYSPADHQQAQHTKAQEPPWAISVGNSILHNLKKTNA